MSRSTIIIILSHFTTLNISGRWLSSSILTTDQGRGSHKETECQFKSPEAVSSLGNYPAQSHRVWPPKIPHPQARLLAGAAPERAAPARLWEPIHTAGLCDSTIPCPARRPGPRTDSWKSLRPPMTPFKASSVWLFDS